MADTTARVLSYSEWPNLEVCRLQLASGEKLYIKVIPAPTLFAGVWLLGSLNPVAIATDWLVSRFTRTRTAGLVQLWGLGAKDMGGPEAWHKTIDALFDLQGGALSPLKAIAATLGRCDSVAEVERLIAARERAMLQGRD
jgi:hypothetical protein